MRGNPGTIRSTNVAYTPQASSSRFSSFLRALTLLFPNRILNDGVLVQSYMSAYDTSFADASRIVEKEVNEFIGLLHEEGKAHLDNIGEIHYNIFGNYEFVPYDYKITTPSFMVSTLLK